MMKRLLRWIVNENVVVGCMGFLGSVTVGSFLAGWAILDWTSPAFQYLVYGAGTALLYVVWKNRGFLESTTYALSLALYCAIPARDLFLETFVSSALFFLFACCSYPIVWKILGRRLSAGRFLMLALLFALFEIIKTPLLGILLSAEDLLVATSVNTVLGGTIGLGVGAGIEIAEALSRTSWLQKWVRLRSFPKSR